MIVTPATFFFYFRTREDPERTNTTALLTLIVLIRNARWLLKWFAWLLAGSALAVAAIVSTPWVPKEQINDAEEVYVFETSPGSLKVLGAHDRKFKILRTEDVRKREEPAKRRQFL